MSKTFERISTSTSVVGDQAEASNRLIVDAKECFVVVTSHDCEFNENKRNKFVVARLQPKPKKISPEDDLALRESNDFEARIKAGHTVAEVAGFLYEAVPGATDNRLAAETVVSFITMTSLPMEWVPSMLAVKQAELTHEHRVLLRKKIAYFFGREADDIPEDEKQPHG